MRGQPHSRSAHKYYCSKIFLFFYSFPVYATLFVCALFFSFSVCCFFLLIFYRRIHSRNIRFTPPGTKFCNGTTGTTRILKFVWRLVGLLCIRQPATVHRLVIGWWDIGWRFGRHTSCIAKWYAGIITISSGRLSTGHSQYDLSMRGIEYGGTHYITGCAN